MVTGTIMEALGLSLWHVLLDNGTSNRRIAHTSNVLTNLPEKVPALSQRASPSSKDYPPLSATDDPLSLLVTAGESQRDEFKKTQAMKTHYTDDDNDLDNFYKCYEQLIIKIKDYDKECKEAKEYIKSLIGKTYVPLTGDLKPKWKVVNGVDTIRTHICDRRTYFTSLYNASMSSVLLFLRLWPGNMNKQLQKLNAHANNETWEQNKQNRRRGIREKAWKNVTEGEWLTFISLFSASDESKTRGARCKSKLVAKQWAKNE